MPTLIDVAGASYPEQAFGNEIPPLDGVSLRPAFAGKPLKRGEPIFIEHENNAFVRDGRWKLVGRNVSPAEGVVPERWELYDMQQDRTELHNLADEKADLRDRMADAWDQWAKRVGVYPKPGKKVKH